MKIQRSLLVNKKDLNDRFQVGALNDRAGDGLL